MQENDAIQQLIFNLKEGYQKVSYSGKTYGLSARWFNEGRSGKLFAEHLGGTDFISCNWYKTQGGFYLKPCEMPLNKVLDFLKGYQIYRDE